MGWLVAAMPVEEVVRLNLSFAYESVVDTLSAVGSHVTDSAVVSLSWVSCHVGCWLRLDCKALSLQLDAVASQLELQNPQIRTVAGAASGAGGGGGDVDPDSLLVALGPTVCSLRIDLQRLLLSRRGALQHAARSLQGAGGAGARCNATCLAELATAAVADTALGHPASWTAEDVRDLGVIVAGGARGACSGCFLGETFLLFSNIFGLIAFKDSRRNSSRNCGGLWTRWSSPYPGFPRARWPA